MSFTLPPLGYEYDYLTPSIDAQTMEIHYTKHHQAYVNNLNAAVTKFPELGDLGLADISKAVGSDRLPKEVATAVRNNGGGHWNHSFFWRVMTNPSSTGGPSGEIKDAIEAKFGSVDEMQKLFSGAAAGRFGSGWAWLVAKEDGSLEITSTPNQDNPLMPIADVHGIPVLGLDVWEHAYYLKYQNRRPEYITEFWKIVNWERVAENYSLAKEGKPSI